MRMMRSMGLAAVAVVCMGTAACATSADSAGVTETVTQTETVTATVTETVTEAPGAGDAPVESGVPADPDAGAATEPGGARTVPLAGSADPTLSDASDSPVAVVVQGDFRGSGMGGTLPLIVRNNSADVVHDITATGSAQDADGKLVGSGSDQGFTPNTIAPGGIALGYVYFSDDIGQGAAFDIEVDAEPGPGTWSIDLPLQDLNQTKDSILGKVVNDTGSKVSGPISINGMCFDEAGTILRTVSDYAAKDDLAPGATSTFSLDLYGDPCPTFLLGARGYSG